MKLAGDTHTQMITAVYLQTSRYRYWRNREDKWKPHRFVGSVLQDNMTDIRVQWVCAALWCLVVGLQWPYDTLCKQTHTHTHKRTHIYRRPIKPSSLKIKEGRERLFTFYDSDGDSCGWRHHDFWLSPPPIYHRQWKYKYRKHTYIKTLRCVEKVSCIWDCMPIQFFQRHCVKVFYFNFKCWLHGDRILTPSVSGLFPCQPRCIYTILCRRVQNRQRKWRLDLPFIS